MSKSVNPRITLENVVSIFNELDQPQHYRGDTTTKKRWSMSVLLEKDNKDHMAQFEAMKETFSEVAKDRIPNLTKVRYDSFSFPWKDGATVDPEKYPEIYLRSWAISINRASIVKGATNSPPYLCEAYDPKIQIPNSNALTRFPDGTIVAVSFDAYPDTTHGSPQMCAGLIAVQFLKKGEAIEGRGFDPEQHFKAHERESLDSATQEADIEGDGAW